MFRHNIVDARGRVWNMYTPQFTSTVDECTCLDDWMCPHCRQYRRWKMSEEAEPHFELNHDTPIMHNPYGLASFHDTVVVTHHGHSYDLTNNKYMGDVNVKQIVRVHEDTYILHTNGDLTFNNIRLTDNVDFIIASRRGIVINKNTRWYYRLDRHSDIVPVEWPAPTEEVIYHRDEFLRTDNTYWKVRSSINETRLEPIEFYQVEGKIVDYVSPFALSDRGVIYQSSHRGWLPINPMATETIHSRDPITHLHYLEGIPFFSTQSGRQFQFITGVRDYNKYPAEIFTN